MTDRPAFVHPTALVEAGVRIGAGTSVWDGAHIRRGARLGRRCIVGEKTYIAYGVRVGDLVKINAMVYVCAGVTIRDGCMISAGTVFTNDLFPRATEDFKKLVTSAPTSDTLSTLVDKGATIGANCTVGPGLRIGAFSMVGMGSVVTRDVPAHHLVYGQPARFRGVVCACGRPLASAEDFAARPEGARLRCPRCRLAYAKRKGTVRKA